MFNDDVVRMFICFLLYVPHPKDALNVLRLMSVLSLPTLLCASMVLEEPSVLCNRFTRASLHDDLLIILMVNCAVAFLVNLTQFIVTARLGALSMQVWGNLKTVTTAVASVYVFRNQVTPKCIAGYLITFVGVALYNRKKNVQKPHLPH